MVFSSFVLWFPDGLNDLGLVRLASMYTNIYFFCKQNNIIDFFIYKSEKTK